MLTCIKPNDDCIGPSEADNRTYNLRIQMAWGVFAFRLTRRRIRLSGRRARDAYDDSGASFYGTRREILMIHRGDTL